MQVTEGSVKQSYQAHPVGMYTVHQLYKRILLLRKNKRTYELSLKFVLFSLL